MCSPGHISNPNWCYDIICESSTEENVIFKGKVNDNAKEKIQFSHKCKAVLSVCVTNNVDFPPQATETSEHHQ